VSAAGTVPAPPSGIGGPDRRMVSLRLTREAREILRRLAERRGVSQGSVLELLLREASERG